MRRSICRRLVASHLRDLRSLSRTAICSGDAVQARSSLPFSSFTRNATLAGTPDITTAPSTWNTYRRLSASTQPSAPGATPPSDATTAADTTTTSSGNSGNTSNQSLSASTNEFLESLKQPNRDPNRQYSEECYRLLEAWMHVARTHKSHRAAKDGEALLLAVEDEIMEGLEQNQMPESKQSKQPNALRTSRLHYDLILNAYSSCSASVEVAESAERLLGEMMSNAGQRKEVRPNTKSFNIVIYCWAKSKSPDAAMHVQRLYQQMQRYHQTEWGDASSPPPLSSSPMEANESTVAHGTTSTDNLTPTTTDAATATATAEGTHVGSKPNARTLTGVLESLSTIDEILSLLKSAIDEAQRGSHEAFPLDSVVFSTAIRTISQNHRTRSGATAAESILRMLEGYADSVGLTRATSVIANSQIYSMVLHAWAQCESTEHRGDATQRAQDILVHMVEGYKQGKNQKPNTRSFTTCIGAWSHCAKNVPHAAVRAEQLLDTLLALHEAFPDDTDFAPDTSIGNAVLSAWSRSDQSIDHVLRAFDKLKTFARPDLFSYNCLLHAHSRKGDVPSALALLDWMEGVEQATDGGTDHDGGEDSDDPSSIRIMPDTLSYNNVMSAIANSRSNSGSSSRSSESDASACDPEELLRRMLSNNISPSIITYTSLLRALDDVDRAMEYLEDDMIPDPRLQPDHVTFDVMVRKCSSAINSAINNGDSVDTRSHLQMLDRLLQHMKPVPKLRDSIFCNIIQTCSARLASAGRDGSSNRHGDDMADEERRHEEWIQHVAPVVAECKRRGVVSRKVLMLLRRGSIRPSRSTMERVLGTADTHSMPREWSRNVPRQHRP